MFQSACDSIQTASAIITTQIAGPAQPWKCLTASMPLATITIWMLHRIRKAIQPSTSSPSIRVSASPSRPGMKCSRRTFSAIEARKV